KSSIAEAVNDYVSHLTEDSIFDYLAGEHSEPTFIDPEKVIPKILRYIRSDRPVYEEGILKRFITEVLNDKVYYHGTTSDAVAGIMSSGLKPDSEGEVWVTTDRYTAFMNGAMRTFYKKKRLDVQPVILNINPPEGIQMVPRGAGDFTIMGLVEPKDIKVEALIPDEIESFSFFKERVLNKHGWK